MPRTFGTAARDAAVALAAVIGPLLCMTAHAQAQSIPSACAGVVQMPDVSGDAHHADGDVLRAWFSEQNGRLQAVVVIRVSDWSGPEHEGTTAGVAVTFELGGARRYVRVESLTTGPPRFDHGTWTLAGGFASAGATTGHLTAGVGATAVIDVPPATGAVAGAILARPVTLTYNGNVNAGGHWVDRAPGETEPDEPAVGSDYRVGVCNVGGPGTPGAPGGSGGPGASAGPGAGPGAGVGPGGGVAPGGGAFGTIAVTVRVPRRVVGARRIEAEGEIVPAREGVAVRVVARPRHGRAAAVVRTVVTRTDGSFAAWLPLSETSTLSAAADGLNAQTSVVTVRSTVRMTVGRRADGRTVVSGRVSPWLPGRVLLLRAGATEPTATARARQGRFRFAARRLRGRFEAVFVPSGSRAERSTSKPGVIR